MSKLSEYINNLKRNCCQVFYDINMYLNKIGSMLNKVLNYDHLIL